MCPDYRGVEKDEEVKSLDRKLTTNLGNLLRGNVDDAMRIQSKPKR